MSAGDSAPIEVHLADGGHVIIDFADPAARVSACDRVVETILGMNGSESDLQQAISADADNLGLSCSSSEGRHPTVIIVGLLSS